MKISNYTERVRSILIRRIEARDDDFKLISHHWYDELISKGINPKEMSAEEFLRLLYNGRISSGEAITRARRKIQETDPDLRGKKYDLRHRETKAVKKDLGYNG